MTFDGEKKGRAIGIWAAVGAGAGAIGPLVGGALIDSIGWRSIFLVNLPIAAGAIWLALRYVAKDDQTPSTRLDATGGALATFALAALTFGLTRWSAMPQADGTAIAAVVFGLVGLTAFVLVERQRGDAAMMPVALFSSADFVGLSLLTLLLYGALGALLVMIPYVLIEARGYSATEAGAALIPFPLVIAIGSSTMGRLAAKIGPRWPLTIGPIVAGLGCWLAIRIAEPGSYWSTVLPALLVVSLGMTGAVAPLTTAVLSSVRAEHTGVASGFNSAIARTGGLIATALLGGLLAAQGAAIAAPFKLAAIVASAAALAAGACAFVLVGRGPTSQQSVNSRA